jgi:hypothetical protein
MALPNNTLSSTPLPAPFNFPRQSVRYSAVAGMSDVHLGGVALGDPSQGLSYQLWQCYADSVGNIWLTAPNTPAYAILPNVGAAWVALAFDQNSRVFIAYATSSGNAFYYWFDSTIPGYRTSNLTGDILRVFAALDDNRPITISGSDVILAYVRLGVLYMRVQRDRFGVEYTLGNALATMVQIGMNAGFRFQFAFQNAQGTDPVPPAEYTLPPGVNPPS